MKNLSARTAPDKLKAILLIILCTICCHWTMAQQTVSSGRLVEYPDFNSSIVTARDVVVWLPDDYSTKNKYDVLYMHDGQALFDATTTWNAQEWQVDEVMGKLTKDKQIRPCIVVAVSNAGTSRYSDYFPQKTIQYLPGEAAIPEDMQYNADNYLRFLVEEVKPFIDKEYSTHKGTDHTFVMGSSMGGLISLYALCEYPNVFGGAGCVSTHVPMITSSELTHDEASVWATAFRGYLNDHLPKANSRLIYMDRGDATLDAFYPVYQDALDELMVQKGWTSPAWISKVFPGAGHSETDWAKRLNNPLQFLLGNPKVEKIDRIEPEFWWCGMKNTRLQLMVYGNNIALYTPTINYPGIKIESVHPMESPNYLVIYLDVQDAKPGKFNIEFTRGKKKLTHPYELKARTGNGEEKAGFNSSDVVYLLMPDRFANGDESNDQAPVRFPDKLDRSDANARHGGDLAGIMQHLDYLDELGITAVWTTPVLENDMGASSYHGYAATNYYRVDPRLGTNEEYALLSVQLKERDMKLIMDMVFNHCGSKHPWMFDPPMNDWFNNLDKYVQTNHNKVVFFDPYAADADRELMTDGWFVPTMPDLNQRNRFLADYLIQNSIWWVEYADLGGIRQDTYPYPDIDMMVRWCEEVMHEYPNLNIVGEVMLNEPLGTAYWQRNNPINKAQNTGLKSVMDFHLHHIAGKAFQEETSWDTGLQTIFEHFAYDFCYPDIFNVMRVLENHDGDRFFLETPKDLHAYKQAVTLLLTVPGIPQVFYGQELAVPGSAKIDFGYIRPDMPGGWKSDATSVFTSEGRNAMQQEAHGFMQKLLQWRKGNNVIAKGSMKHFMPRNNVYIYQRAHNDKSVVVIMNGVSKESEIDMDYYKEVINDNASGKDILTGKTVSLKGSLKLGPKEVLVIEL